MKTKITVTIDLDIIEKMRDLVHCYPVYSISGLVQESFKRILEEVEGEIGVIPSRTL